MRKIGEEEEKRKKEKNIIWREVEGKSAGERRCYVEEVMERELARRVGIERIEERKREGGRWVLIVYMESLEGKKEVIGRRGEIGRDGDRGEEGRGRKIGVDSVYGKFGG